MQLARTDPHRDRIAAAQWDLVIVDEAHHARRSWDNGDIRANLAYQLLALMRDRVGGLLLLTATPMQLHEFELYSMVELVQPGLFEGFAGFLAAKSEAVKLN